jgi:hypothetical protein
MIAASCRHFSNLILGKASRGRHFSNLVLWKSGHLQHGDTIALDAWAAAMNTRAPTPERRRYPADPRAIRQGGSIMRSGSVAPFGGPSKACSGCFGSVEHYSIRV